jgi:Fic family protein
MSKLIATLVGAAVIGMTGSAIAQTTAPTTTKEAKEQKVTAKKDLRWKAMDTNNDGMISQEEFMKYHETVWQKVKRNAKGLAVMADVDAAYAAGMVPSAIPGQPTEKAKP